MDKNDVSIIIIDILIIIICATNYFQYKDIKELQQQVEVLQQQIEVTK